jgi:hypothetical protein
MCEAGNGQCNIAASWSVYQPAWPPRSERFIFMCKWHGDEYHYAMTHPIPGIDKPEGASEDWRPSLFDMIKLAAIKMNHEDRMRDCAVTMQLEDTPRIRAMTPEQRETVLRLRKATKEYGIFQR